MMFCEDISGKQTPWRKPPVARDESFAHLRSNPKRTEEACLTSGW